MYVFLTACRNEERILPQFLAEFVDMIRNAGIERQSRLYVVDDLSIDGSVDILERARPSGLDVQVIRAPTNFGNQGAMFFGLACLQIQPDDVLITFDCDGEDDVAQIPSIIALGASNPGKVVMVERGERRESFLFKLFFASYKVLFRFFTGLTVIPNNFLLIPGSFVPAIRSSPMAAVHFAYAILKLRPAYVATTRDRRTRYGGKTSQDLFMLVSHGLVGLMLFYEVVVAKIFMLLFIFGGGAAAVIATAMILPADWISAQRALVWSAISAGVMAAGLFGLLLSAALALILKLAAYTLVQTVVGPPSARYRDSDSALGR